jgi:hypothetical protein
MVCWETKLEEILEAALNVVHTLLRISDKVLRQDDNNTLDRRSIRNSSLPPANWAFGEILKGKQINALQSWIGIQYKQLMPDFLLLLPVKKGAWLRVL